MPGKRRCGLGSLVHLTRPAEPRWSEPDPRADRSHESDTGWCAALMGVSAPACGRVAHTLTGCHESALRSGFVEVAGLRVRLPESLPACGERGGPDPNVEGSRCVWAHPWAQSVYAGPAFPDTKQQQLFPIPCSGSTGRKALIPNGLRPL